MVVWFIDHLIEQKSAPTAPKSASGLGDLKDFLYRNVGPLSIAGFIGLALTVCVILLGNQAVALVLALLYLTAAFSFIVLYLMGRDTVKVAQEKRDKAAAILNEYMELKNRFDEVVKREQTHYESAIGKEAADFAVATTEEKSRLASALADKIAEAERREKKAQQVIESVDFLGKKFLDDTKKWVISRLTMENFVVSKEKILKVIQQCRDAGYPVNTAYERDIIDELKNEYEMVVRRDYERQEQARIKERIREEEKAQREFQREIERAEAEKRVREKALAEAMERVKDEHSSEVEDLKAKLAEAEEKLQRTKSMAQQTKAGHIYIISNIGSFGEKVFKIGMTRRLVPLERVKELGDASVPFPFDVHMMIHSDDAPTLESALHEEFHNSRLNKVNMHKEFFRVDFESLRKTVERLHGEVSYVVDAEALQYRQSLDMPDEDFKYISEIEKKADHLDPGGED